jgi:acetyl-CoA carboxylase biotin carboxyl carrier protein
MMDLDEIRRLLELMREHGVAELELEQGTEKLRLRKAERGGWTPDVTPPSSLATPPAGPGVAAAGLPPAPAAPVLSLADDDMDLAVVKSPIVGTFFAAPEPGSRPFVEVGQSVRKGQALCIIEAMKLMNEIDAEYDGEIVKVYVENGQPVQYGERLFAIRPA